MVGDEFANGMAERNAVSALKQKCQRSLLIHQDLRVITARAKFPVARNQHFHQFWHPRDRFGHERSSDCANTRVHGIDHQQPVRRKHLPDDAGKSRTHTLTRLVSPRDQRVRLIGKRQAFQRGTEFSQRKRFRHNSANRTRSVIGRTLHLQPHRPVVATINPGVIHLGEIMIFRCQPEHGDGGDTTGFEFGSNFNRSQSLVYGIGRTRKQANLLASHNSDNAWRRQLLKRSLHESVALVERRERPHDGGAAVIWKIGKNELRRPGDGLEAVRLPGVQIVDPLKVINEVGEQFRGVGQFRLADTRTLHGLCQISR